MRTSTAPSPGMRSAARGERVLILVTVTAVAFAIGDSVHRECRLRLLALCSHGTTTQWTVRVAASVRFH